MQVLSSRPPLIDSVLPNVHREKAVNHGRGEPAYHLNISHYASQRWYYAAMNGIFWCSDSKNLKEGCRVFTHTEQQYNPTSLGPVPTVDFSAQNPHRIFCISLNSPQNLCGFQVDFSTWKACLVPFFFTLLHPLCSSSAYRA